MAQNNIIAQIEKENQKPNAPQINVGDTVKVFFKVIEGEKERIQVFSGVVIAKKNGSVRESFTVRHISFGVGVERTFPVHSPKIDKIEIVKQGVVKQAKLYYLRELTGKKAKIKEKVTYVKKETKTVAPKKAEVKKTEVKTESK